jgi:aryl-alcohol dehydrogenase-like predicted oxidoreductase
MVPDDPNAGGNNKKNMHRALKESLERLQTDYVDILYVHFWDWSVDYRDLMRDLDEVIKIGKVRHIAASDIPAWVVAAANTYAEQKGYNQFVAYQGNCRLRRKILSNQDFII